MLVETQMRLCAWIFVSMGFGARYLSPALTMLNFVSQPSPCGGSWVGAELAEVLGTLLSLCTPLL